MIQWMKTLVTATIVCSATVVFAQPDGYASGNVIGIGNAAANQNVPKLTGWWASAGGGTPQFFQEGKRVTTLFITPDFAHKTVLAWDRASLTFMGNTTRVTRANGCTLQLNIKVEPQSDTFLLVSATLDPTLPVPPCSDLLPGQTYYDTNTKIPGT
jgi:hypothetical protein